MVLSGRLVDKAGETLEFDSGKVFGQGRGQNR